MTQFPAIPLDVRTELQLNGTWTNVSLYNDWGPVSIGRGHPDESTTTSASTLALTLNNADGRFSPNNPSGPYYPYIAQNVPCRISIPAQSNYLRTEVDAASGASCPDAAGLRITTDLDVRLDVQLTDSGARGPAYDTAGVGPFGLSAYLLAGNWGASGTWGWLLTITGAGDLALWWSTDGVTENGSTAAISTLPLPWGRQSLRATLQLSTGTVTFYTGPAGNAASNTGWTQLGSAVVTGATSLHGGTSGVTVGPYYGSTYELVVMSGIGGTVVAHPVFSSQSAGTPSFTDAESNTWTLSGTAEISSRSYRGHFEIASFPKSQDPTGKTVTVAVNAGGLLRRKGQGTNPTASAMTRAFTRPGTGIPTPVAYIPMEDGGNATSLASGIGGLAASFTPGLQLAQSSAFACSNPLPQVNGAIIAIPVPAYSGGTANVFRMLWNAAAGAVTAGTVIARMSTAGTVAWADLVYSAAGSLEMNVYNSAGSLLATSGSVAVTGLDGGLWMLEMDLFNSSGSVGWNMATMTVTGNGTSAGGTVAGSIGNTTGVTINPAGALSSAVTVGQASVQASYTAGQIAVFARVLDAWAGEAAGVRFARLCSEESVQFRGQGNLAATMLMGTQTVETIVSLLQECADADRGVWTELRQQLGWGYVTRAALYNQPVQLALDYNQDHLAPWSSNPTRDDQAIGNDVTLTQSGDGTTARQFAAPGQPISGGRLSTLPPPAGCGVYDGKSATVNLYNDSDMAQLASWMVHLGTVDQDRHPGIAIDLANTDLASLYWTVLNMDLGARLTIANPPVWLQPDMVSQLANQITENLWATSLTVDVAGVPESPYEVAQDGGGWHLDTDGSALCAAVSSTATALTVASAGIPWTTSAGDLPFNAKLGGSAGEVVTVTAVGSGGTGSVTSPGTFAYVVQVPLPPGTWLVGWTVTLSGTVSGSDANNFAVDAEWSGGSAGFTSSVNAGAAGTYPQAPVTLTIPAGATGGKVAIKTNGTTPTTGSTYAGTVTSPQAMTVTRSVNGVVVAQAAGAAVNVYLPPTAAL